MSHLEFPVERALGETSVIRSTDQRTFVVWVNGQPAVCLSLDELRVVVDVVKDVERGIRQRAADGLRDEVIKRVQSAAEYLYFDDMLKSILADEGLGAE